jgi:hypothetical protein
MYYENQKNKKNITEFYSLKLLLKNFINNLRSNLH